jgi:hypothetical protein
MRITHALLIASALLVQAPRAASDPIVISLSPAPGRLIVGDRVSITVTLSNVSGIPRYLQRDVLKPLFLNVRKTDGTLVLSQPDPPFIPQPYPTDSSDLIWLDKGASVRVVVRLPLRDLGIREAGVFKIIAFWSGIAVTESQLDAKEWGQAITFPISDPVEVTVFSRVPG